MPTAAAKSSGCFFFLYYAFFIHYYKGCECVYSYALLSIKTQPPESFFDFVT